MIGLNVSLLDKLDSTDKDPIASAASNICNELDSNTNYVGIGGVFDWVAGTKKKAPEWLANMGLEWLLRLVQDPKRLYKRYLVDNTLFVLYFLRQVLFRR